MTCPRCRQENPSQAKFCMACGVRLVPTCSRCQTELPAAARFCPGCGEQLVPAPEPESRAGSSASYAPKHLGAREIRGKTEPQPAYRLDAFRPDVTRFADAVRRGLTPFVGREAELAKLTNAWSAARTGARRVVSLVGDPGLGKSRIVHELLRRRDGEGVVLQGTCTPYGRSTPFLPFIEIVRAAFEIHAGDGAAQVRRRLVEELRRLDLKADDGVNLLLSLLGFDVAPEALRGLDGEIIGARTCGILEEFLRERCRLSPTIMFVDDVHWTDAASEDLLRRIVRDDTSLHLLLVTAYRPEYRPPWFWELGVEEIRLEPLAEQSCSRLIRHRLGTDDVPDDVTREVLSKAEGNPLFAEEIINDLVERRAVVTTAAGASAGDSPKAETEVPGNIRDVIMARVDRLPDAARAVLEVAAVIGRHVRVDLLQSITALNGSLGQHLQALQSRDLLLPQAPDELQFKHGLIADVVYDSLLGPRRAEIHASVGMAIEQLHGARIGEWAEVLAHHFARTEQTEKAVRYAARAGEKSLRVYAVEDAHQRFHRVTEILDAVPGTADDAFLADVLLAWARAHYYRKDLRGLLGLERYLPRVESLGSERRLALFLFWLGFAHVMMARPDAGWTLLQRALALGETLQDDECIGYACMGLGFLYQLKTYELPPTTARTFAQRGLAIGQALDDVYLTSKCLLALTSDAMTRGRYAEARDLSRRMLELGESADDPRSKYLGIGFSALVCLLDEDFEEAVRLLDESEHLVSDPLDSLCGRAWKGLGMALGRGSLQGMDMAAEAIREIEDGGAYAISIWSIVLYGGALATTGRLTEAVRRMEEFIEQCAACGAEAGAFGHLVLGEIYLSIALRTPVPRSVVVGNLWFLATVWPFAARRARRHLEEARRVAVAHEFDGLRARCLLNLSQLCRGTRNHDDARRMLDEASALTSPLGAFSLMKKIETARARLDPGTAVTRGNRVGGDGR